ncbi:hypothetical protein CAFE_32600 [Caprobacter fermentans]|uniref:Uncharacterized protein n=1 Tax=Caproicibacter fermentans TaxID=2576756 RepID=A0A6N8I4J0_9FIRM|nr:hypothetical protein [Caproicibacter fermentans]MVB12520.1 hypothetical protein [Caproicibacter fermentans]
MNSISGKRYESLTNSSVKTPVRASEPVQKGRYLQGWVIRGGYCGAEVRRRNGSRDMCRKRPQNHGNGFAVREKRNSLYHQYSSGAGETQALPVWKAKGYCRSWKPRDTTPKG